MRIPYKLNPIDTSKHNNFSPKSSNNNIGVFLIKTPINYEKRQDWFSCSFKMNASENLNKIAMQETPSHNLRHIHNIKKTLNYYKVYLEIIILIIYFYFYKSN